MKTSQTELAELELSQSLPTAAANKDHRAKVYARYAEPQQAPQHSPLPWYQYRLFEGKREGQMICTDGLPRRIFGKNNEYSEPAIVCQAHCYTSTTPAEAEANAAYIIRCVNNAEKLAEALREIIAEAVTVSDPFPSIVIRKSGLDKAGAALADWQKEAQ